MVESRRTSREATLSASAAEQAITAANARQAISAIRLNIACYVNTIEEERCAPHYAAKIVAGACSSRRMFRPTARHRAGGPDLGGGGGGAAGGDGGGDSHRRRIEGTRAAPETEDRLPGSGVLQAANSGTRGCSGCADC